MGQRLPLASVVSQPNGINGEVLTLCIGARVALCRNICIALGLVNSSLGEVVDIIMLPGGKKIKFVLVRFYDYKGPILCRSSGGEGIPIFPFKNTEMVEGRLRSYTALPLSLRYAHHYASVT